MQNNCYNLQIIEVEECRGIQEGIPNATKENISKTSWLKPNFADDNGNLKTQTSELEVDLEGIKDSVIGNPF